MKNVFGIRKGAEKIDGEQFVDRVIEERLANEIDDICENIGTTEKGSRLPVWITIIAYVALFVGALGLMRFISDWIETESFSYVLSAQPALLPVALLGLLIWACIFLIGKLKYRNVADSAVYNNLETQSEKAVSASNEQLRIPADAKKIDVFTYPYQIKKGKERPLSPLLPFRYLNTEVSLFREGEALCFADVEAVVKIPFENIVEVVQISKRATVSGWNKQVAFNNGEYRKYKLRANGMGVLFIKPYYSVRINKNGEDFEILIACYDIEAILALTGM